jgi:hypothetical protein
MNWTLAPVSGGRIQPAASARNDGTSSFALEKQNAPEAAGLQTRERHSALTAMRRAHRKRKRNSIYPHYSRVRRSWPVEASRA